MAATSSLYAGATMPAVTGAYGYIAYSTSTGGNPDGNTLDYEDWLQLARWVGCGYSGTMNSTSWSTSINITDGAGYLQLLLFWCEGGSHQIKITIDGTVALDANYINADRSKMRNIVGSAAYRYEYEPKFATYGEGSLRFNSSLLVQHKHHNASFFTTYTPRHLYKYVLTG